MSTEEMIIREISHEGYSSGEAISEKLGITRSAVWKHIVKLRESGYEIEASPRHGYRLVGRPDKLLPAELLPMIDTRVVGSKIVHLEETGSTADEARRLIEKGTQEGTVVIAESQTAGRGRMGRQWVTPPGQAVALSLILYAGLSPTQTPLLSLATAVAVARSVGRVAQVNPSLKWPNDIYLGGGKLGGVLVEMSAELDRVRWIIDSIGINVNNSFRGTGLEGIAVSLAEATGKKVSRLRLVAELLGEMDRLWQDAREGVGLSSYREEFERLDILQGKKVQVTAPGGNIRGTAIGIDGEGRLLVDTGGGALTAIFSGEATIAH